MEKWKKFLAEEWRNKKIEKWKNKKIFWSKNCAAPTQFYFFIFKNPESVPPVV